MIGSAHSTELSYWARGVGSGDLECGGAVCVVRGVASLLGGLLLDGWMDGWMNGCDVMW